MFRISNIKLTAVLLLASVLSISGCSVTPPPVAEAPSATKSVPITDTIRLDIDQVWPLPHQGTYVQKIKTSVKGQDHSFMVHLTLDKQKIDFVAFNDLIGRLYHFSWTPDKIDWEASDKIPDTLRPENIIADFLLVHLPLETLKKSIHGAEIEETTDGSDSLRILKANGEVVRTIRRSKPMGPLWEKVTIENPKIGYTLHIQTVPAS